MLVFVLHCISSLASYPCSDRRPHHSSKEWRKAQGELLRRRNNAAGKLVENFLIQGATLLDRRLHIRCPVDRWTGQLAGCFRQRGECVEYQFRRPGYYSVNLEIRQAKRHGVLSKLQHGLINLASCPEKERKKKTGFAMLQYEVRYAP